MSKETLEVQTRLTNQIFICAPDGLLEFDHYGEQAKFIAEAQLINQDTKECKILHFESREPFDIHKTNIHNEWLKFNKLVATVALQYRDKFKSSHVVPNKIKL
jgi:hypothetical protein